SIDLGVWAELRELGKEDDLFNTLIAHFINETPGHLEILRAALLRGDAPAVARMAHELKGSSGNLGAKVMSRLCDQLQVCGKAGDLAAANPLCNRLEAEFDRVQRRIRAEQANAAQESSGKREAPQPPDRLACASDDSEIPNAA
ncbi:MAG: Hpt domain-containing protein, partial [Nitrospiraceae bacterium]